MSKKKAEDPKPLPTMFKVGQSVMEGRTDEYTIETIKDGTVVAQFKKEASAVRLCDLLNAGYTLFKNGEKAPHDLNQPTTKVKVKKSA